MDRNDELSVVYVLWKKLCELQNILFDHYGSDFMDLHIEELSKKQSLNEDDVDWPF